MDGNLKKINLTFSRSEKKKPPKMNHGLLALLNFMPYISSSWFIAGGCACVFLCVLVLIAAFYCL